MYCYYLLNDCIYFKRTILLEENYAYVYEEINSFLSRFFHPLFCGGRHHGRVFRRPLPYWRQVFPLYAKTESTCNSEKTIPGWEAEIRLWSRYDGRLALGGMLLGSMFGMGGSGMGILPFLLLGVVGFFLYKRFTAHPRSGTPPGYQAPPQNNNVFKGNFGGNNTEAPAEVATPPPVPEKASLEEGLDIIRIADPDFDADYFVEIASDVFFKVQAGWMRRDISSYRHLLGEQLASEYETQFTEMEEKGELNKLENISIRNVKIVAAGSESGEDFVTVLFTANLLDYTVDDKSGELISGSMTEPVKFAEEWSWARPLGTQDWRLEGIKEV